MYCLVEDRSGNVVAVQFDPGIDLELPAKSRVPQAKLDLAKLTKAGVEAEKAVPLEEREARPRPVWVKDSAPVEEPLPEE